MAFDAFLKVEGVQGESADEKHRGWMEIQSYNWLVAQASAPQRGGGKGAGTLAQHGDFCVLRKVDLATPVLFRMCCFGENIKAVTVEICRAGGDKACFLKYAMTNVILTSYNPGASAQEGDSTPVEELKFNYGSMEVTYRALTEDGKQRGANVFLFEVTAGDEG